MRALIIGGTGFIGQHLANHLNNPIIAGRSLKKIRNRSPGYEARQWDPTQSLDPGFFDGVDGVFHLAGESIFKGRWNTAKKERIRNSRVESTRRLVDGIGRSAVKPRILVCSSAVGIYGDRGDEPLTESSRPGDDFLARVCRDWEQEALRAQEFGVRVALIRTAVVLGRNGGALAQMLPPFKLGLGGRLGSGNQYMPWIHIEDLCRIMLLSMKNEQLSGPVNAVAPNPVTNRAFTRALAQALHRPALFPVPGFLLKMVLGE
ncbi:MAG TPA: TIGR01777 family protein, partial [Desulfobulbus sp.]|nr:TIGR01777 family protein [Desulfobulbus sp.]